MKCVRLQHSFLDLFDATIVNDSDTSETTVEAAYDARIVGVIINMRTVLTFRSLKASN